MHRLSQKVGRAWEVRIVWLVELTNTRNQEVCCQNVGLAKFGLFTFRDFDGNLPLLRLIIPMCFTGGSAESDVLVKAIFGRNSLLVILRVWKLHQLTKEP
jgi:hypothetical protein